MQKGTEMKDSDIDIAIISSDFSDIIEDGETNRINLENRY